jgi:hypothetical protein
MNYALKLCLKVIAAQTRLLLCLLSLASCSAGDIYEIGRQQGLQSCELQPLALQRSCREKYQMSYAEYQRLLLNQEGRTEKR